MQRETRNRTAAPNKPLHLTAARFAGPALKRLVHLRLAQRHGSRRSRILQLAAAAALLCRRHVKAARG
jgi:hypothetical protein